MPVPATATTAVERSERAVWRAVIALAVSDAVAVNRSISGVFSEHDISEARTFLTAVSGEWAKHRRFVCALADLEETRLVAFARNAIKAVAG